MSLPPSVTETDFLAAVEKVAERLSKRFSFGCYDSDDIRQEIAVYGMELLAKGKYDPARRLDGYLYRHAHRRLANLKRDKFMRADPPCRRCYRADPCRGEGRTCDAYAKWLRLQVRKASLMGPKSAGSTGDAPPRFAGGPTAEEVAEANELRSMLDDKLPVPVRADYRRMLDGVQLKEHARKRLRQAVAKVLDEQGMGNVDAEVLMAA